MTKISFSFLFLLIQIPLHSGLYIEAEPFYIIKGQESHFEDPKGICFSPKGDKIAVVDSHNDNILLYTKENSESRIFSKTPHQVYSPQNEISRPYCVDFHPNGTLLSVGSLDTHTIYSYQLLLDKITSNNVSNLKVNLKGSGNPMSLAFTPDHKYLAISCRGNKEFVLFYKINKYGQFKQASFLNISNKFLEEYHLAGPKGLSFSQDGNLLATIHQRYTDQEIGLSAVTIFRKEKDKKKGYIYRVHSIIYFGDENLNGLSFHPSGNYLAVLSELNHVRIFERVPGSNSFLEAGQFSIEQAECCQEVAFSPNGDCMVVSTTEPTLLFFHIEVDHAETLE